MGERGPKPKYNINLTWRPELAYAVGLLVTDGNLSPDGRHISFVSKDIEQIKNFNKCLGIAPKLGKTFSGFKNIYAYRSQFGNIIFYNFLLSIGLTPAKSKTISKISIPHKYFFDFLRGSYDGDGCFYSYWDPRWKSSHMFYLTFASASMKHILWLREEIENRLSIKGHVSKSKRKGSIYNLRYAKKDSLEVIKKIYYNPKVVCLPRKRDKIKKALKVEDKQQKLYA